MGWRPHRRRAALGDERGAVVVIVVLAMIALVGMTSLVVDLGGVFFRRTALQHAADASALAAANACGTGQGTTGSNAAIAYYTGTNSEGAVLEAGFPTYSPMCDSPFGEVTVEVVQEQPVFFAGIFGSDGDMTVRARATAIWGGAGAKEKVAPLMLSKDRLTDCDIPPEDPDAPVTPQPCTFYWDNSSSNPSIPDPVLTNAEWGTLDLNMWDVEYTDADTSCDNSTPPDFSEWMFRGFDGELPISAPTTYVCRGQGNFGAAFDKLIDDAIALELPLYFPVNDPQTQIDRDWNPCTPGMDCSVDKYNIIGFARLIITDLWRGKKDPELNPCAIRLGITLTANSRCVEATWTEYTNDGLNPTEGENFGLVPVRLVE